MLNVLASSLASQLLHAGAMNQQNNLQDFPMPLHRRGLVPDLSNAMSHYFDNTRSMPASLAIGVSAPFKAQYPDVVAFFEKVDLPIDLLNLTLA
ncbi:hypothetical protein PS710_05312 [Pseudomonas fluorescens]|uniref:Uncharacterized protein n=1 Tax=Pseudomonas fluorescens TaxID=294 RepID=A0A5E7F5C1_PSEFL|nr:hypothetical protein PS710_05312 [Pseudomonas fluorescens]